MITIHFVAAVLRIAALDRPALPRHRRAGRLGIDAAYYEQDAAISDDIEALYDDGEASCASVDYQGSTADFSGGGDRNE